MVRGRNDGDAGGTSGDCGAGSRADGANVGGGRGGCPIRAKMELRPYEDNGEQQS